MGRAGRAEVYSGGARPAVCHSRGPGRWTRVGRWGARIRAWLWARVWARVWRRWPRFPARLSGLRSRRSRLWSGLSRLRSRIPGLWAWLSGIRRRQSWYWARLAESWGRRSGTQSRRPLDQRRSAIGRAGTGRGRRQPELRVQQAGLRMGKARFQRAIGARRSGYAAGLWPRLKGTR
jgi:hypothetical protein